MGPNRPRRLQLSRRRPQLKRATYVPKDHAACSFSRPFVVMGSEVQERREHIAARQPSWEFQAHFYFTRKTSQL